MDNLQAFPSEAGQFRKAGMTLRDYFASASLNGLRANTAALIAINKMSEDKKCEDTKIMVKIYYEDADAMLKERSENDK